MSRKTAFVNDMVLQSLKQNQQVVSPIVKTITKIDDKIKDILDNKEMDEYKKVQLYSQTLQEYLNTRNNLTAPSDSSTPSIPVEAPPADKQEFSPYGEYSIIDTMPVVYRNKAKHLLRIIKNNDNIKWDDNGVVSYKDNVMKHSNIVDLVHDVIRPRKHSQPNNWLEFTTALHELNVPQNLIGNPKRRVQPSPPPPTTTTTTPTTTTTTTPTTTDHSLRKWEKLS